VVVVVVVVVPVVDVSVVEVVGSVDAECGRGPASTVAASSPPTPRLSRRTAAATLRTRAV
jgi:hypothetical protein